NPQLVIDLPKSFVHKRVEILVITLDDEEAAISSKRRTPPPQSAERVKELGDVISSVSAEDWGHGE
ncbi:MAG: hypothetical protein ACU837_15835, partial [Gammaproteobacteria bacterium]